MNSSAPPPLHYFLLHSQMPDLGGFLCCSVILCAITTCQENCQAELVKIFVDQIHFSERFREANIFYFNRKERLDCTRSLIIGQDKIVKQNTILVLCEIYFSNVFFQIYHGIQTVFRHFSMKLIESDNQMLLLTTSQSSVMDLCWSTPLPFHGDWRAVVV